MTAWLPYIAISLSFASLLVAAATFWRAGRWKEDEVLKALIEKVDSHGRRLAEGEERFKSLATSAEVARLQAEVKGLERSIDKVDAGVIRIERLLMEEGRK